MQHESGNSLTVSLPLILAISLGEVNTMKEIWKDVVGYEGLYQISSLGRIKSNGGVFRVGNTGGFRPEKILSPTLSKFGYYRLILCDGKGGRKSHVIHRLVAEAFIPNPENKPQVNHIDEDKTNNSVSNLEWVTCKENINWGTANQRRIATQRLCKKNMKTTYQYDKNYNLVGTYISCKSAARALGINKSGIQHCCNGDIKFPTYKGYIWRYEKIERA